MTRVWTHIVTVVLTGFVAGFFGPVALAQDKKAPSTVAGAWRLVVESPHGALTMALDLKVDSAGKVTGTMTGEPVGTLEVSGKVAEGRLTFAVASGPDELSFAGKLKDADTIVGMLTGHGDMACTATRAKTR